MSQLGDATDVVALLTPRSINRPWILYEAGVAKGKLDTNVLGIALGVPLAQVSTGPFGQFQNSGDDEDSLTKLVLQLLRRNPDAAPREEAVRVQVRVFRDRVKVLLAGNAILPKPAPATADETNIARLFEEVKVMVRELPERVDDRVRSASKKGIRRWRRLHPLMVEDAFFHPALAESPHGMAVSWLFFISVLRDDVPWLYDVGRDLYEALRSGQASRIAESRDVILQILEVTRHGPWYRELFGREDEELHYVLRHLPEFLDRLLSRTVPPRRPRAKPEPDKSSESRPKEDA